MSSSSAIQAALRGLEIEDPTRERVEREWAALRAFFQTWFVTSQGQFIAALNQYASEDQFERQLETLLRKWLADKVADGRVVPWPAAKGSPFRGLSVFGAKHASVFFGRSGDVRKAGDLWRDAARRGTPFLLIVGASGAGKSSMARAGLLPRITTPGVVAGVDVWRVATLRPSDSPDGPFAALAMALLQREADLPHGDDGRGPALPEIGRATRRPRRNSRLCWPMPTTVRSGRSSTRWPASASGRAKTSGTAARCDATSFCSSISSTSFSRRRCRPSAGSVSPT